MTREEAIRSTHAFLTGQLTEDEKQKFMQWRDATPEHEALFEEVRFAWELSHSEMTFPEFDAEAAFDRLPLRARADTRSRRRISPVWRVAAAILIVVAVSWVAYQYVFKSEMLTVTGEHQALVVLSDETTVYLRADATLTYPAQFQGGKRRVTLEGTGYFDVTHDPEKPFLVDALYTDIIVVGTEFGVVADAASATTSLFVKKGLVRMHPHQSGDDQYIEVGEGEGGVYDERSSELRRVRNPDMNAISWHTRELSFLNTPIPEVIEALESTYEVEIDYANAGIRECQFTSPIPFEGASIDDILGSLAVAFQLKVNSPEEGKYTLIGGSCTR